MKTVGQIPFTELAIGDLVQSILTGNTGTISSLDGISITDYRPDEDNCITVVWNVPDKRVACLYHRDFHNIIYIGKDGNAVNTIMDKFLKKMREIAPQDATHFRLSLGNTYHSNGIQCHLKWYRCRDNNWSVWTTDNDEENEEWRTASRAYRDFNHILPQLEKLR